MGENIDDIIDEQQQRKPVIEKPELLQPDYIVEDDRIVGRNDKMKTISGNLVDVIHGGQPRDMILYGPSGSGKTLITFAISQRIRQRSRENDVKFEYVSINGDDIDTLDDSVHQINLNLKSKVEHSEKLSKRGVSTNQKWTKFKEISNKHLDVVVIIIDEADLLIGKKEEVAYSKLIRRISRLDIDTNVGVILMTNDSTIQNKVGSRTDSSFRPKEIVFQDYDANQLRKILEKRKDAFKPGTLTKDVIPLCAALSAKTHGDARKAVDLLRCSGELVTEKQEQHESKVKVRKEHVRQAYEDIVSNRALEVAKGQAPQKKYCLLATAAAALVTNKTRTGIAYDVYKQITKKLNAETHTQETLLNRMKELTTYKLVEGVTVSQGSYGRTTLWEFDEDPEQVVDALLNDSLLAERLNKDTVIDIARQVKAQSPSLEEYQ